MMIYIYEDICKDFCMSYTFACLASPFESLNLKPHPEPPPRHEEMLSTYIGWLLSTAEVITRAEVC
jgi:hypothetical protein